MIFSHENYRSYLKEAFTEKVAQKPSFSLRLWARQLQVAPSYLSEVLGGKKPLSFSLAERMTEYFHMSEEEAEYFVLLVQFESARNRTLKESLSKKIQKLNPNRKVYHLDLDFFKVISDWYHFPILELTQIPNFELTPKNISKTLEISPQEAELAIERLIRLELIEKNELGQFQKCQSLILASSKKPNEALRKFHSQMLEKASEALKTQSPLEKVVGSETFAFDPESLQDAVVAAKRFVSEMVEIGNRSNNKKAIYHLGIQFFRLGNLINNEKEKRK